MNRHDSSYRARKTLKVTLYESDQYFKSCLLKHHNRIAGGRKIKPVQYTMLLHFLLKILHVKHTHLYICAMAFLFFIFQVSKRKFAMVVLATNELFVSEIVIKSSLLYFSKTIITSKLLRRQFYQIKQHSYVIPTLRLNIQ